MPLSDIDLLYARIGETRAQSVALIARAIRLRAETHTILGESEELRRTITAYGEMIRRLGTPPDRAFEAVRLMADEALSRTNFHNSAEREAFVGQLVLWVLDAYAA